jgi:hypothetical protein
MLCNPKSGPARRLFGFLFIGLLSCLHLYAQVVQITKTEIAADGRFKITFDPKPNSYYILLKGNVVTSINAPVALTLAETEISDTQSSGALPRGFYQLREVLRSAPFDSDNDGIDDVYELQHATFLNPLNSADASLDPDGDGFTYLDEYRLNTTPLAGLVETSPANGDSGVSVTRKTILRFTMPLSTNTVINTDNFYAGLGGRKLLSRVEFSSDRKTATLLYLEPMPGSTRITAVLNGTGLTDYLGRPLDLDGDGQPGGHAIITFDTSSTTALDKTAVIGRVFAAELIPGATNTGTSVNKPLENVTITVDGQEETLRTRTDAQGNFKLFPTPAGRFFVHIDGRTATLSDWPNGAYYPVLGKAWEAVAGKEDNLAAGTGTIYLPLIAPNTLQPVSATTNTMITFPPEVIEKNPALNGVAVMVPANSLYGQDGTRGGSVGIAPVPSDRLPEPLPPGLTHTIDISIQTDGENKNFDRPVPVRFPNLPDPVTGLKLPPGAKSALWSFNHDTAQWEIQGPMTVTPDGNFVVSDPGVGVKQPGWHGTMPGTQLDTDAAPPPEDLDCDQIQAILNADYAAKAGTGAAPLAHQIACIAQKSCAHEDTWAGGFVKKTFQDIARNKLGSGEPPNVLLPGTDYICRHISGSMGVPGVLTSSDICAVLGGFGHHFPYELLPAFAQYCNLLDDDEHHHFFNDAVVPCFTDVVGAGELSPWAGAVAQEIVPPSAAALRETMQFLCPLLTEIGIARQGLFDFALAPQPYSKAQLFSPSLAALGTLQITAPKDFFVQVGDSLQLKIFKNLPNGTPVDITAGAQGTQYFVVAGPQIATISADGLLAIRGTLLPFPNLTTSLFVVVQNGQEFAIAQFAIQDIDSDGDFIVDSYERLVGLDPMKPNLGDSDGDGLTDLQEVSLHTNPLNPDTDGDNLSDRDEVRAGLDPLTPNPAATQGEILNYALTSLSDGSVQRGRTPVSGRIQGKVIKSNTRYKMVFTSLDGTRIWDADFDSAGPGGRSRLHPVLRAVQGGDIDNDGLADEVEIALGTDPLNPDTDGDGIPDGVEVQQGTDPLSGLAVRTGTLLSVPTPGNAVDVCALNNVAVVADSEAGVSVFNVFSGLTPTLVAQVPTPGAAQRVACSGNYVAVSEGGAGLSIIDISQPPQASILHHLQFGGAVASVAANAGFAYVGMASGRIVLVDMASGSILDETKLQLEIKDIAIQGTTLAILADSKVTFMEVGFGEIHSDQSASLNSGGNRIFLANNLAYITYINGFNSIDITDPLNPKILAQSGNTGQRGWQQIIPNGSGMGVAAAGVNGPEDIYIYDLSNISDNTRFVTLLDTPGQAHSVSIYNGLAYVADGNSGLTLVNYLAYDNKKLRPSITLAASFSLNPPQAEEGKLVRAVANVSDDVQVRNVEFYIDGQKVITDGNFPFEYSFVTATRSASKTSFILQAKATDTGGNSTWTDPITVVLVPDATPPRVRSTTPAAQAILGSVTSLSAFFNEPLDAASINNTVFTIRSAGPDSIAGNSDDLAIAGGQVTYRPDLNTIFLTLPSNLPPALYTAELSTGIRDLAGNAMAKSFQWSFWVFNGDDRDHDGIPDLVETALGLDPQNPSSLNDGILDGDRDLAGDGLKARWKIFYGYDPRLKDTDATGTPDAQRDPDFDGLTNLQEQQNGTNPFNSDTDGDRWDDKTEITEGTDPLNRTSTPRFYIAALPAVDVLIPGVVPSQLPPLGALTASPAVEVIIPGPVPFDSAPLGMIASRPAVDVLIPGLNPSEVPALGSLAAQPSVDVLIPGAVSSQLQGLGTITAHPAVDVLLPAYISDLLNSLNLVSANPPVTVQIAPQQTGTPVGGGGQ